MKESHDSADYFVLPCEKPGLQCQFVLKPNFAGSIPASKDYHYHFHPHYEVHFPIRGALHIISEEADLSLAPGQICIIPPDKIHYTYGDNDTFRVGFRFSFSGIGNKESDISRLFTDRFGKMTEILVLQDCPIYRKYLTVAAENLDLALPDFMISELLFMAVYEIAARLDEQEHAKLPIHSDSNILISEQIENFLNQNYSHPIRLKDLSTHLHLGERQTERMIHKLFHVTFCELVNKKRLSTAKFLLKNTDMSPAEIAQYCGFPDVHYFYRRFSCAFSVAPIQYRKQSKTPQNNGI